MFVFLYNNEDIKLKINDKKRFDDERKIKILIFKLIGQFESLKLVIEKLLIVENISDFVLKLYQLIGLNF